jgi:hypothetical protein
VRDNVIFLPHPMQNVRVPQKKAKAKQAIVSQIRTSWWFAWYKQAVLVTLSNNSKKQARA